MIGTIIKNMRTEVGLSQKQLGKMLNVADTTISSYERGNSQLDFDTIIMIFELCGYQLRIEDSNHKSFSLEEFSREK